MYFYRKIYNRNSIIDFCQFNRESPVFEHNVLKLWTSIDEHFALMWHIIQGRIPASLFPLNNNRPVENNNGIEIFLVVLNLQK